jgi:hypothetical protein
MPRQVLPIFPVFQGIIGRCKITFKIGKGMVALFAFMRKKVEHALGLFRFFNINRRKKINSCAPFSIRGSAVDRRKKKIFRKKKKNGKEKKQQKKKLVRY